MPFYMINYASGTMFHAQKIEWIWNKKKPYDLTASQFLHASLLSPRSSKCSLNLLVGLPFALFEDPTGETSSDFLLFLRFFVFWTSGSLALTLSNKHNSSKTEKSNSNTGISIESIEISSEIRRAGDAPPLIVVRDEWNGRHKYFQATQKYSSHVR